ncbi:MAG TPA: tetratricopeptide repeat protein [Armatimonadota bacterium]|nr:tetratricopeptide repeat protein [Armatimonadota bacterium]
MSTTLIQKPPRIPPTDNRRRIQVAAALVCLLFSAVFRQVTNLDVRGASYRPSATAQRAIVGGDWFAGMLLGFREMVADMMWIQVDEYFHEGRYDKILPVCYIITAMDPQWIDVYSIGAWHLGYNFGDRRLVPAAIAFDKLGVKNNPKSADMAYELGWMEYSRGYNFLAAARDFKRANDLGLQPLGRRHAWPHALEAAGDIDGAIAAWKVILKQDPTDVVAKKNIFMTNLRKLARKDLGKKPVDVHLDLKITRKGPRVLHFEGVTNLPKYSKIFFELRDSDWRQREKQSLAWQMSNYTLYSQLDTTLKPSEGIFQGEAIDFYQGDLHIHQGQKTYDQFPTEPMLPVKDGHMIIENGEFHGDIDMAKYADQYPLRSKTYELEFYINPLLEPITTQDIIGWHGEGLSGPLMVRQPGYNEIVWKTTIPKSDIQ